VFSGFLSSIEHNCVLCSPFIGREPVSELILAAEHKQIERRLNLLVVTDISLKTLLLGATDIDALSELQTAIANTRIVYLPGVHAKVYVADTSMAMIGSANFTAGGISRNLEYVACVRSAQQVHQIRSDIEAYANLGSIVSPGHLATIRNAVGRLRQEVEEEQRIIGEKIRQASEKLRRETEDDLIRVRVGGTSINAIFSRTIEYLLNQGPLSTDQLHQRIRDIHPDLCDDTVDRVIDGVRYGKLWKHQVRTAQQHLKRANRIALDEEFGTWRSLIDTSP